MSITCKDCGCEKNRIYGVGLNSALCYDCEDIWKKKEGLWIDPAGGAHSRDEEDPALMYR